MPTYRLDSNDRAVQVSDYEDFAAWYCENKDVLVLERTDIRDKRGKFVTEIITRFRSQVDGLPEDPDKPLVWVTETLEGDFLAAVATKEQARKTHYQQVDTLLQRHCEGDMQWLHRNIQSHKRS